MMKKILLASLFIIPALFTMEPELNIPSAALCENPNLLSAQLPFEIRERLYKFAYPFTAFYWAVEVEAFYNTDQKFSLPGISLTGHTREVTSARYSPDGKLIATASWDGTVGIWDAHTGREIHILVGHNEGVTYADFSPDGLSLVSASMDDTARVWDVQTGKTILSLIGHTAGISMAQFSHDGRFIVTASSDSTAVIWDAHTGKQIRILPHTGPLNSAEFSPDDHFIVTTPDDRAAHIWDVQTGTQKLTLEGHTGDIRSASFNSDGQLIVTASFDNTIRIWNLRSNNEIGQAILHLKRHVYDAQFSPDSHYIASASSDSNAYLWHTQKYTRIFSLKGHADPVYSSQFSPNGQYVVTASADKTARIWKLYNPKVLHYLQHNVTTKQAKLLYEIQQAAQTNPKLDLRNRPQAVEILMSIAPYVREMLLQHVVIEEQE